MRLSGPSAGSLAATVAHALETIMAVGNKFFLGNGTQFFMKGIAYQLTERDPLVDTEQCQRDAALMQTLGTNSIRIYHVDAEADHDGCMAAFEKAGIYTLIDLDAFNTYILPKKPWWNETQYRAYSAVMDAFFKHTNLQGFFVGNEIIALKEQSGAAPFIKAAAHDLKAYCDSRGYRKVPIGYSAADIAELRPMLQDYLTWGGNSSEMVDFIALKSYEWCGQTTYEGSGHANLQAPAKTFFVPIFFSETGCNIGRPRTFADQTAIFGPQMANDWSGAMMYEWIQEANEYGLISYGPKPEPTATGPDLLGGFSRRREPMRIAPDFDNLRTQWATLNPKGVAGFVHGPAFVSTRECPAATSGWLADRNVALPSVCETFKGSFASSPIATNNTPAPTGSQTGSAASPFSTQNPAPADKQMAGMSAALVAVMLFFTVWL